MVIFIVILSRARKKDSSDKSNWLAFFNSGLLKFIEFVVLLVFSVVSLSYLAAAILGFSGIYAPFNAFQDVYIRSFVVLFSITIAPIIWVRAKSCVGWQAIVNGFLIPCALVLTIATLIMVHFPGVGNYFQTRRYNNLEERGVVAFFHKEKIKVYSIDNEKNFVSKDIEIKANIGYPIVSSKGEKKDGIYILVNIMIPDESSGFSKKATNAWARISDIDIRGRVFGKEKKDKKGGEEKVDNKRLEFERGLVRMIEERGKPDFDKVLTKKGKKHYIFKDPKVNDEFHYLSSGGFTGGDDGGEIKCVTALNSCEILGYFSHASIKGDFYITKRNSNVRVVGWIKK